MLCDLCGQDQHCWMMGSLVALKLPNQILLALWNLFKLDVVQNKKSHSNITSRNLLPSLTVDSSREEDTETHKTEYIMVSTIFHLSSVSLEPVLCLKRHTRHWSALGTHSKLVHGAQRFLLTGTAAGLCFKPNKPCLTTASFDTPNGYMALHLFFCRVIRTLPSETQIIQRKLWPLCSARYNSLLNSQAESSQ